MEAFDAAAAIIPSSITLLTAWCPPGRDRSQQMPSTGLTQARPGSSTRSPLVGADSSALCQPQEKLTKLAMKGVKRYRPRPSALSMTSASHGQLRQRREVVSQAYPQRPGTSAAVLRLVMGRGIRRASQDGIAEPESACRLPKGARAGSNGRPSRRSIPLAVSACAS